jgi:hypothetical protein
MNQRQRRRKAHLSRGRYWGKRCSEYCAGCICCEAWKFYDEQGRFPTFEEAHAQCDEAMRKERAAELQAIVSKHMDDRGNCMSPAGLVNDIKEWAK